ncbi:MAG: trigger factor [Sedimentisphaerales bacterium]|nr:trigger factor [Sedimentisphaerales bacterium]
MAQTEAPTNPSYKATIEQVGPCKKRVIVEIPEEAIQAAMDEQYKALRQEVILPGFRRGKAPRRLLEKRLGKEAQEQVKLKLVRDTSDAAIRDNNLAILGEPQINVDELELPVKGPLSYQFEVEVWPEFELPALEGIPVEKTVRKATDQQVEAELIRLRRSRGIWVPRNDDEPSQSEDLLIADVDINVEGEQGPQRFDNAEIHVRPHGTVCAVPVSNLDKHLVGVKAGQSVEISVDVPKTYFKQEYRGKKVQVAVKVKEIKYLRPADLDQAFLGRYGVESEGQLRDVLREAVQAALERQTRQEMEDQIYKYLLDNTKIDLPLDLVADQTAEVLQRMYVRLLSQGLSHEEIEGHIEALRTSSEQEAKTQVKTFFVIDKVCEKLGIEVSDEEVNGLIAQIALRRGQRPERLKEQMARDGSLGRFRQEVRQRKAIDKLLEMAKVTEVAEKQQPKPRSSRSKGRSSKQDKDDTGSQARQ